MSRHGVLPWLWPPPKSWLVNLIAGLSRHVKDMTRPHILMACSSTLKLVALMACGRTGSGRRVVGCERSVSRTYPWFPMRHGNSVGSGALVIFIMHQTHDLAPFHGRGGQCKGLGQRGVVMLHGRKARDGQALHMAGEPPHMVCQPCP